MTDSGSPPRPPPGRSNKGKAKVGEPTNDQSDRISPETNPSINPSEGQETNAVNVLFNPGPCPARGLPAEAMCFHMELKLIEVSEPHMKLHLSRHDAFLLTESDELKRDPPTLFSRDLLVLDKSNRLYKMNISNHSSGSLDRYHVNTEWRELALSHKLGKGDTLVFYRFLDDASRQWYYRLKILKVTRQSLSGDNMKCCLSRTLSSSEVCGGFLEPILILDEKEAYALTNCEEYLKRSLHSFRTLHVYDESGLYVLKLAPFIPNKSFVGYFISGDWAELAGENKLVVGDRIFFYLHPREENANATSEYSNYVFKFLREKPKLPTIKMYKRTSEEEKCPDRTMKPGPGSRNVSNEKSCFARGLTALEVVHDGGKPRLFLDAQSAGLFLGYPNIDKKSKLGDLRENLVVYDAGNRPYDMLLSHFRTHIGEVMYVIDAGWQRFVKIHTLTAGDSIFFYRIIDDTVHDKPYYVVRYFRNNIPNPRGMSGTGPRGSTRAAPVGSIRAGPGGSTRAAPVRSFRAGPGGRGARSSGSTGAGPSGSGAGPSGSTRAGPSGSTGAGSSGSS